MLKFKPKPGIKYYPGTTIRIKDNAKPLKRTPLKPMSKKTKKRIVSYRQNCFERWGTKCFLCGCTMLKKQLDCHHIDGREIGDNIERIVPLCNRFSGCKAHNHNFKDKRFYELKEQIERKLK